MDSLPALDTDDSTPPPAREDTQRLAIAKDRAKRLAEAHELHRVQLERWGGQEGVRDLRALESAIAQPQATFDGALLHEDIFAMAAAYAFHIAEAQAFLDGNKRTGVDAALTFLALNGFRVEDPECALYDTMIEISAREMTKAQLASLLRELAAV
jgi:death-on-curing protein